MSFSNSNHKILIIGGSGHVSGTLARMAVAEGHEVWTVTRGERPVPDGVIALTADRHDVAQFAEAIKSADARWDLVVDCIGYDPQDVRQDISVFRDLAKQFVFVSTDFVFNPFHRTFPQGETSDYYQTEGYGGKKRQCELELIDGDTGDMEWTILRPCHIYGPGSELGCLPMHSRDTELIDKIRAGVKLELVGGGYFLQQPILARDLAKTILSVTGNKKSFKRIFQTAGPDIVESREYYRIIAEILGVGLEIEELPVYKYLAENPGPMASFICHRIYDLNSLRDCGLSVPSTPIEVGLKEHVESLLAR